MKRVRAQWRNLRMLSETFGWKVAVLVAIITWGDRIMWNRGGRSCSFCGKVVNEQEAEILVWALDGELKDVAFMHESCASRIRTVNEEAERL